jgi:Arc/MetJ family transcription regulator
LRDAVGDAVRECTSPAEQHQMESGARHSEVHGHSERDTVRQKQLRDAVGDAVREYVTC